jgi:hypothetical protein
MFEREGSLKLFAKNLKLEISDLRDTQTLCLQRVSNEYKKRAENCRPVKQRIWR